MVSCVRDCVLAREYANLSWKQQKSVLLVIIHFGAFSSWFRVLQNTTVCDDPLDTVQAEKLWKHHL